MHRSPAGRVEFDPARRAGRSRYGTSAQRSARRQSLYRQPHPSDSECPFRKANPGITVREGSVLSAFREEALNVPLMSMPVI
jgi:hypothetical protein